jgi:hypothetical protein
MPATDSKELATEWLARVIILLHVQLLLGKGLVKSSSEDIFLVNSPLLGHATIGRMFIARC